MCNDQVTESNIPEADAVSDSEADAVEPHSFDELWHEYPRKRGKEEARKGYQRTVLNHADALALRGAIANFKHEIAIHQTPDKYVMGGGRFFSEAWKDFAPGVWMVPKPATSKGIAPPVLGAQEKKL